MNLTYNFTRHQAANFLNVSTRTIDRYIRSGRFSYEKRWNQVFLSEEELQEFYDNNLGPQKNSTQKIVNKQDADIAVSNQTFEIDQKLEEILNHLREKDRQLEEKNKVIFNMQNTIANLEEKLQNTMSLPDYSQKEQEFLVEKERLQLQKSQLKRELDKERIKNIIFLIIMVFLIVSVVFYIVY